MAVAVVIMGPVVQILPTATMLNKSSLLLEDSLLIPGFRIMISSFNCAFVRELVTVEALISLSAWCFFMSSLVVHIEFSPSLERNQALGFPDSPATDESRFKSFVR